MLFSMFCLEVLFSRNKCVHRASSRTAAERVGDSSTCQVPRAYDTFHDDARQINNIYYEKTRPLGKKWKTAFNSSSRIHKKSHILVPLFFWLLCGVMLRSNPVVTKYLKMKFFDQKLWLIWPFFQTSENPQSGLWAQLRINMPLNRIRRKGSQNFQNVLEVFSILRHSE